jgi:hypothetical protein
MRLPWIDQFCPLHSKYKHDILIYIVYEPNTVNITCVKYFADIPQLNKEMF